MTKPAEVRYAWAPITKKEKLEDGSIVVHGPAADPSTDRDKQKLGAAWLAEAFPAWVNESGNIREQHDPKRAVGRAVGYAQEGDTHMLAARVVDPVAVAKIEADVLQGFSVGVKNPVITFGDPEAPMGTVVGGQIIEVSVVDRPANPNARFTLAKADAAGELEVVETELEDGIVTGRLEQVTSAVEALKADVALVTGHGVVEQLAVATGADTSSDGDQDSIASAQAAIAAVAKLIQGEAESLAAGNLNEAYDIDCLLDAVRALRYFISCEREEQAMTKADTTTETTNDEGVTPGAEAEVTKADQAVTEQEPELTKAQTFDVADLLKTDAFTDALGTAVAAALAPLTAKIEKMEATPLPGGPVLARTADQLDKAQQFDKAQLTAEAEDLLAKADRATDRTLQQGYRDRAANLLAKANA